MRWLATIRRYFEYRMGIDRREPGRPEQASDTWGGL